MIAFVLVIAWALTVLVWLWQVTGQGILPDNWREPGWRSIAVKSVLA